jgi:hypothetical protein
MRPGRCLIDGSEMASMWNRIGGLLTRLSSHADMEPAAALALWMVECGGLPFCRGKPVLRFEPHVFFNQWGKDNEELFDRHFQFGSRNGIEGARWQNHRYRTRSGENWRRFHGEQVFEYLAFALAARLAGREAACRASSMGGPQIMGFNHALVGYPNANEMFRHFASSERWQVCGFFDFCASKDLFPALRKQDWRQFASVYNGPGNAEAYAAKIAAEFETARRLLCTVS